MPFISISVKKLTCKSKACMTNQYFTVSSSQIKIEVKKIMKTWRTSRSAARPSMKRSTKPRSLRP